MPIFVPGWWLREVERVAQEKTLQHLAAEKEKLRLSKTDPQTFQRLLALALAYASLQEDELEPAPAFERRLIEITTRNRVVS